MNKTVVGIIAAVAATAVLGVTGVSAAVAAQSEAYSTVANPASALVKAYHDLAVAAESGDVKAIRAAVKELIAALTSVRKDADRGLLRPAAVAYLTRAETLSAELQQKLSAPTPRDGIGGLVSSLLDAVQNLLNSLLGGGTSTTTTTPPPPPPAPAP